MIHHRRLFWSCLLLLTILITDHIPRAQAAVPAAGGFRAVWVSTVLHLDYPAVPTADAETLARQADEILDDCAAMGFNAVILQVRPAADALYPSALFPWSRWITGTAGQAPDAGFDPLAYWIEGAHARGMELHVWINPYRITKNTADSRIEAPDQLPEGSPARAHPDWVVSCGGDLYFDPALDEVQALVADGVRELLDRYAPDGIHLDDYFYPGADFDDAASYARLGGSLSLADWRRENVTRLIRLLSRTVSAYPGVAFGVSPGGIWANESTDPRGSATAGGETYTQSYADTRLWVEEGLLDYICPQIYWHMGHPRADYVALTDWWSELCRDTGVRLYIGMAAYRVDGAGEDPAWQGPDELLRQLDYNRKTPGVDGVVLFRYGSLEANPALRDAVQAWFAAHPVCTLAVNLPETNLTTDLSSYYLGGTAAPGRPLTCNGEPVESLTESGFFGIHVPLSCGANVFTFEQDGAVVRRVITRVEKLPDYGRAGTLSGAFPASDCYALPGTGVELSCAAPLGASVKAEFYGRTYVLVPDERPSSAATTADTTIFRAAVTLPGRCLSLQDLGAPVYTLRWRGVRQVLPAAHLHLVPDGASLTAHMENDTYGYSAVPVSGGSAGEYAPGMTDRVTELRGQFLRLGSGLWVRAGDVKVTEGAMEERSPTAARHTLRDGTERVTLNIPGGGAGLAGYDADARILTFRVSPAQTAPPLTLRAGSLFSSCETAEEDGCAVYRLTLREDAGPGGFSTEADADSVSLMVTAKRRTAFPPWPLRAHTILLDPGHGGATSGTVGLLGSAWPEKDANLELTALLAEKLRSLGATVVLTRMEDIDLSLEERVARTRELQPDLFLSIHCNNLTADADMTMAEGFSVYYREPLSRGAAETLYQTCRQETGGPDYGLHRRNFYVCRGSRCPALLFETAFMSNPRDFENLRSAVWRDRITDALVQGILHWFETDKT